jgi:hypothetical protein
MGAPHRAVGARRLADANIGTEQVLAVHGRLALDRPSIGTRARAVARPRCIAHLAREAASGARARDRLSRNAEGDRPIDGRTDARAVAAAVGFANLVGYAPPRPHARDGLAWDASRLCATVRRWRAARARPKRGPGGVADLVRGAATRASARHGLPWDAERPRVCRRRPRRVCRRSAPGVCRVATNTWSVRGARRVADLARRTATRPRARKRATGNTARRASVDGRVRKRTSPAPPSDPDDQQRGYKTPFPARHWREPTAIVPARFAAGVAHRVVHELFMNRS